MRKNLMIALATALTLAAPAVAYAAPDAVSMSGDGSQATCSDQGLESKLSTSAHFDPAIAASATNTMVVPVPSCASSDVVSGLAANGASEVRDYIRDNAGVIQAIQAQGYSIADVLGATTSGNTLTVYVEMAG